MHLCWIIVGGALPMFMLIYALCYLPGHIVPELLFRCVTLAARNRNFGFRSRAGKFSTNAMVHLAVRSDRANTKQRFHRCARRVPSLFPSFVSKNRCHARNVQQDEACKIACIIITRVHNWVARKWIGMKQCHTAYWSFTKFVFAGKILWFLYKVVIKRICTSSDTEIVLSCTKVQYYKNKRTLRWERCAQILFGASCTFSVIVVLPRYNA